MHHAIHLDGVIFSLRPIRVDDAALVVELRADVDRARYLNPIVPSVSAQETYLHEYLTRDGDYYFVVEDRATRRGDGLIALYDVDPVARSGEIGRWVVRPGSAAAVESILLAYRIAFDVLGLDEVRALTVAGHKTALSFHDRCGLERRGVRERDVQLGGRCHDRIEHVLTRERWPAVSAKLSGLVGPAP